MAIPVDKIVDSVLYNGTPLELLSVPPYTGSYEAIPKFDEETILQTKDKLMEDDVMVREIPWEETSNPQGGITVTIGGY